MPDSLNNTKAELIPLGVFDYINMTDSLSISNKFEILSQLEEELND